MMWTTLEKFCMFHNHEHSTANQPLLLQFVFYSKESHQSLTKSKWRIFSFIFSFSSSSIKRKWAWNSFFFFLLSFAEEACVTFSIIFYSIPSSSSRLSIEASPNMAPKSSQKSIIEVNVDRGSKVHLPCNIQGNPLPIFTWYRLSDSGSYYSVPSSQRIIPSQTVLLIRNADDRDAGRWVIYNMW